mmetsp:Transcript_560/g.1554  ORF Transcript_560/g.1554 Transcript_560/m.1554 type:complete len:1487 (+) Transcript_560:65-4525(+)
MPAGIDAALKSLGCGKVPDQMQKVNLNGWDGEKKGPVKLVASECTIVPSELGVEACQKIIKEQEFKIRKLKEKMDGIVPSKKTKPDIAAAKEAVQLAQLDGNYKAALTYVRGLEDEERQRRRDAVDQAQEEALVDGIALKKGAEQEAVKKKADDKKVKPSEVEAGPFEIDAEVVGVVTSAVEGSEEAQTKLAAGAGTIFYSSDVKSEVSSMVHSATDLISAKMKRTTTRDGALRTVRSLLWNSPAVLPSLPTIMTLLEEAKLKSEPGGTVVDLCENLALAGPSGKAVPELVLPILLDHLGAGAAGKWKVKVETFGIIKKVLQRMIEPQGCPKQLGVWMPRVMTAVRGAVGDPRKEVKKAAETFLRDMGQELVLNPEIRGMAETIIESIVDGANMAKAAETLSKMGNTTFMNTVDSISFGLIFPVVTRAMREQTHESKMKGVKIVGAAVNLVADPEVLEPYVAELLPLLQECLIHPTHGISREAAKSFGSLASGLPVVCSQELLPYLLAKMESQETNGDVSEVERRGAAQGLAEVLLARRDLLPFYFYNEIIPRIKSGKTNETKAGALAFIGFIAHLGPQAFITLMPKCLQVVLDALNEESEVVTKQALAAGKVLIDEYGAAYPHLLLPRLQQALYFETEEARAFAMQLFFDVSEKIAQAMKFGQDFLSMDALPVYYRHSLLSSIFIGMKAEEHEVRRLSTLLWKEKVQSGPKAKAEILPFLLRVVKTLKASGKKVQGFAAKGPLAELIQAGDVTEEAMAKVEVLTGVDGIMFSKPVEDGEKDPASAAIPEVEAPPPPKPLRAQILRERVEAQVAAAQLPNPLRKYIMVVLASCCAETGSRAAAESAAEEELAPLVSAKEKEAKGGALGAFGMKEALGKVFEGIEDEKERTTIYGQGSDALIYVENLRMMYGGGNLLLTNTTLELKKGHRYGVVGRNGAGKTTLMNTIASGGISQIPKSVKTLHVRPEVLIAASDLTAVQFCKKDCRTEVSDETLQEALLKVGFPDNMQHKAVSELSGGWRMKLLLASAMMQDCDMLLLDEPTNHLDVESVKWLSEYLCSLTKTSLMVISHNPQFLNGVCTDIIQYSAQRTLDYYPGNFDDFRKARHISSDEEAEALLAGLDVDEGVGEDEVAVEDRDAASGMGGGLLDKSSKILFPIPGTLKGHSSSKPVMELKNVYFAYDEAEGPMILNDISCKISLNSRVGIVGKNGAGKSTLLNLLCGELVPSPKPGGGGVGEVSKHRNLRLAYIAQQHMFHLTEFMNSSPYTYIQRRYKDGWDDALQQRLINPENDEEAKTRKELASKYGKYGNEVGDVISRVMKGSELFYEIQWKTLDDPKSNTVEPLAKLKMMGVSSLAKAYDERLASQAAGLDQRPLSQKEIVKHFEQFGLDEDMVMNREIGGFSAGQKSKLTLGAAFWTKPHIVALDEPTNYIDMETLDALVRGLSRYKGGIIVISHDGEFVKQVCNETWLVEGGMIAKKEKDGKDVK